MIIKRYPWDLMGWALNKTSLPAKIYSEMNDPGKSHEILLAELISNIRIAYKPLGTD